MGQYTITQNLFKTKMMLKDEKGKTVISAPYITEYAPDLKFFNTGNPTIYFIRDRQGVCSLFSEEKGMVLGCALPEYTEASNNGIPVLFRVGTETVYVSPKDASKHFIQRDEAICFEQDSLGRPTHKHVYRIKNGMPEEIYNAGISNIDTKRITRYSPCKIIDYCADMYAPLLIKNPSELVCYLGSHSSDEYRDMARDYARVEGVDMLPTYLQTTIDHFRTLASHTDFERETFNHIRKVESLFDRIQQQYAQQAEPVQPTTAGATQTTATQTDATQTTQSSQPTQSAKPVSDQAQ